MTMPIVSPLKRTLSSFSLFSHSFSSSSNPRLDFLREEIQELEPLKRVSAPVTVEKYAKVRSLEISHPWIEWVELIDHLLKRGFMDGSAIRSSSKDSNLIRTACLNFAREGSEMIRYLSRKDIRAIVDSGCPSLDRKVVNSGKRLRAYVGTNEGEVCSKCKLRGNCERAFMKANEDEAGRTLDVMRIVLTHGINAMQTSSVEKMASPSEAITNSVRKLLNDIVNLSIKNYGSIPKEDGHQISSFPEKSRINLPVKHGDWICPKCNFMNFAKNIKCLRCEGLFHERIAKLHEDRDDLPLKKGDWICENCNFLNFAKNSKCLQCNEKPTNRQLNPGEWECDSCCYINFRKNYYCLKCGWKRPKAACIDEGSIKAYMNNKEQLDKPFYTAASQLRPKECRSNFQSFEKRSFSEDNDEDEFKKSEFHDFPIVGGKSDISKDPLAIERWKAEISLRKICRKTGDKSSSSNFKMIEPDESDDEDDIGGWFRE